jgi:hypothetical protein
MNNPKLPGSGDVQITNQIMRSAFHCGRKASQLLPLFFLWAGSSSEVLAENVSGGAPEPYLSTASTGDGTDQTSVGRYSPDDSCLFTASVERRYPFNGDYTSLNEVLLTFEVVDNEHGSGGLFLSGGVVNLKSGSTADLAAYDPLLFEIGLLGRYYLNRKDTFVRPYLNFSMGFALMTWNYRDAQVVDGEKTFSDSLGGIDGYAGLGLTLRVARQAHLFAEAGVGGIALYRYGGENNADYHSNDTVFDSFGYAAVKAGFALSF